MHHFPYLCSGLPHRSKPSALAPALPNASTVSELQLPNQRKDFSKRRSIRALISPSYADTRLFFSYKSALCSPVHAPAPCRPDRSLCLLLALQTAKVLCAHTKNLACVHTNMCRSTHTTAHLTAEIQHLQGSSAHLAVC